MKGSQAVSKYGNRALRLFGEGIGGVFLVLMVLITSVDVLLRLIFNKALFGTTEYLQVFMVITAFFGLASCAMLEKHARADILISRFPNRPRAVLDIANGVGILFIAGILVVGNLEQTRFTLALDSETLLIGFPYWPLYAIISLSYVLLAFTALMLIVRYIRAFLVKR